eukprot:6210819-Pleurochrysis_carterae.AAC.2
MAHLHALTTSCLARTSVRAPRHQPTHSLSHPLRRRLLDINPYTPCAMCRIHTRSALCRKHAHCARSPAKRTRCAIDQVTQDYDSLSFNTAISALMVFSNHLQSLKQPPAEALRALVLLVSPMAPHLGEEAWRLLGNEESLAYEPWPEYDDKLCEEATVNMAVQVNGKARATIQLAKDAGEADAKELALANEKVLKFIEGKEIKKFIYVPGRIVNIVAK